ncbi:indolepyruvate ferredoxin oxidoreductase family protein [Roseomonas sp. M0104]|uniref:Indolepyruvate ferredoxin oxidoreductase family protein n=1 Tax=Teichococcus coralli TaxID=2545983 RepID=A0A845BD08_9PROT|nr:indolepyruvate ferredoxin oxidoreductase family protein [Pseudoroseomonas coralli]MXP64785.1 indolepyruvate ferredoxin oxidoreductase family protein [Pseudoroseomonas coralli]
MADAPFPDTGTPATRPTYLSGIQALVKLLMLQRARDAAAGLNTAGFVSGYRGSPLGSLDQAIWKAGKELAEHRIHFEPGVNEDLAATAVWGSQQVNLFPGAKHDGVFAMWYGKGPGADRSVDVFKHANAAGTARRGGVLAVVGDDHGAKSSTLPHQSDHIFAASMIPVLNPAGVQELLDLGLHGWAMSRFSGCWVGMRVLTDIVETSAGVVVDPYRIETRLPSDFEMPPGGLSIRWPDPPLEQEYRLQHWKVYAAMAYARANRLNRVVMDSPRARFGIIASGKSFLDVLQALDALGIEAALAAEIGLRVYKVGMTWPLDGEGVRHFAEGLEEILVVEEKRQVIEYQLKEQLYNWREDVRPKVTGKYDEKGEWELPGGDWQLPAAGELTPALIARVIARRIERFHTSDRIRERLDFLAAKEATLARPHPTMPRAPHYCSGCPHNTSTRVPEGSRALAGIGCHYMALWLNPDQTRTFSQMGGEGVPWVGQAPFTETRHVFANLGDGTYSHSGLLAIRQAVVAKVPITYKILFNDAVAMTGGQPVEGRLTVPQIVWQVRAEGVEQIVVVSDDPTRHAGSALPAGVPVRHRRDLDAVQRKLRDDAGVSVIVYDQTCAAEKRRRRKRGLMPDPARRVVINDRVCEGCGDCSAKSNCMSVVPVETAFGRKRAIDQSSCNKDYSCLEGFCPSFVTVEGGMPRKGKALASDGPAEADGGAFASLPDPAVPPLEKPYGILVAGVGGTGVVTIGALLGTAAALEGKGITVLDMAGLAQKGGPVWSHVRVAPRQDLLHASRITAGEADLLLGCDIIVAAADDSLSKLHAGATRAVVNSDFSVTSDFVRTFAAQARTGDVATVRDPQFPLGAMEEQIADATGPGRAEFVAGTRLATALLGDSIAANLFLVGYAYQKGLLPLSAASLLKAIEVNGAAVEMNQGAFLWGRRAALDLAAVERAAAPPEALAAPRRLDEGLDATLARNVAELTAYQDARYARRHADLVRQVREAEAARAPGCTGLAEAVAKGHYKLLAAKDEYEVARLYTEAGFLERLGQSFTGDYRLVFHLAPPLWARPDPATGEPRKRAFGPWMLQAFRVLARLRRLRGTVLDPFRFGEDRKLDRRLLAEYERLVGELLASLHRRNHAIAVELAALPEQIRGYGHIRRRHAEHAKRQEATLLDAFKGGDGHPEEGGEQVPKAPVLVGK